MYCALSVYEILRGRSSFSVHPIAMVMLKISDVRTVEKIFIADVSNIAFGLSPTSNVQFGFTT